jgi:hypothetical protein
MESGWEGVRVKILFYHLAHFCEETKTNVTSKHTDRHTTIACPASVLRTLWFPLKIKNGGWE